MNEIARGILEANYHHAGGLKIVRLYEVREDFMAELAEEVARFAESNPPSDVMQDGHVTHWTDPIGDVKQFSLLNQTGRTDDTSCDHTQAGEHKRFHHENDYPAMARFVELFKPLWMMGMRLNCLGPGSALSPHEEHVVHGHGDKVYVRARFHLPVESNAECEQMLDWDRYRMRTGEIYFFNNGCIHASRNYGNTPRYHLVWDIPMSQRAYEAMFCGGLGGPLLRTASRHEVDVIGTEQPSKYQTYGNDIPYAEAIGKLVLL